MAHLFQDGRSPSLGSGDESLQDGSTIHKDVLHKKVIYIDSAFFLCICHGRIQKGQNHFAGAPVAKTQLGMSLLNRHACAESSNESGFSRCNPGETEFCANFHVYFGASALGFLSPEWAMKCRVGANSPRR